MFFTFYLVLIINLILNGQYLLHQIMISEDKLEFICRKPYSKWTISSTSGGNKMKKPNRSRKPYSKWTISSTRTH